jgi:hypothetical protein
VSIGVFQMLSAGKMSQPAICGGGVVGVGVGVGVGGVVGCSVGVAAPCVTGAAVVGSVVNQVSIPIIASKRPIAPKSKLLPTYVRIIIASCLCQQIRPVPKEPVWLLFRKAYSSTYYALL